MLRKRKQKKIEIPAYVPYNQRCGTAKELADRWFAKYLELGEVTPELESERDKIFRMMTFPSQNQR